jgi:hypothetical protein
MVGQWLDNGWTMIAGSGSAAGGERCLVRASGLSWATGVTAAALMNPVVVDVSLVLGRTASFRLHNPVDRLCRIRDGKTSAMQRPQPSQTRITYTAYPQPSQARITAVIQHIHNLVRHV